MTQYHRMINQSQIAYLPGVLSIGRLNDMVQQNETPVKHHPIQIY